MLKTIIIVILSILFLILSIPVLLIEILIGRINPVAKNKSSLAIIRKAFGTILFLSGAKLTVKGIENIPTDRSVLYIGNHRSYFDIIITYTLVPTLTGFIAKKETAKVPLLKNWMSNVNCLFLDRSDIKQGLQTILTACELIKQGISVFIFPEGTRNKDTDSFLPFKGGSFKIATKTGCEIIPVSINNSDAIFEKNFPKIRKAHVIIEFGKPISTKDMTRDEIKNLPINVQNIIFDMYTKNKVAV